MAAHKLIKWNETGRGFFKDSIGILLEKSGIDTIDKGQKLVTAGTLGR
jgi:hypothetical protein